MEDVPAADTGSAVHASPAPHVPSRRDAVESWLRSHAEALVSAVGPDGIVVPMPEALTLGDGQRVEERSLLDLVVDADRSQVATAFMTAVQCGVAVVGVRLVGPPQEAVTVHYIDVTDDLGVVMRLVARDSRPASPRGHRIDNPLQQRRPRLGLCTRDEVARILAVDDATCAMLGWSADQLVGRHSLDFVHPEDQGRALDNWMQMMASGATQSVRIRYMRQDGSWLWVETSHARARSADGQGVVASQLIDISDEMAVTEALHRSERLLRRMMERVPVGLLQLGWDGTVRFSNRRMCELVGADLSHLADLRAHLHDGEWSILSAGCAAAVESGTDDEFDLTLRRPESSAALRCRVTLSAVADSADHFGVLVSVVDITELKTQASIDPLTGVHNRPSIMAALQHALGRTACEVGVLFVDLDSFKPVNDRFGHIAGDRVLQVVADRIQGAVRRGDEIGRLGGDEFVIVCPDLRSPDELGVVADRVAADIAAPIVVDGDTVGGGDLVVTVSASLGRATGRAGLVTAAQLVAEADAAMYVAKRDLASRCAVPPQPVVTA